LGITSSLLRALLKSGVLIVAGFTLVIEIGASSAISSRRSASSAPSMACFDAA